MRRIVTWILGTVTVVVLMFGYHTSTSGTLTAQDTVVATTDTGNTGAGAARHTATSPSQEPRTVAGPVVQTQWGPVQVQVTTAGRSITDVTVLQHPDGNPQDAAINGYALPVLVRETLDAQSAAIDMVSGATVTSSGYVQSLQAALDKAAL